MTTSDVTLCLVLGIIALYTLRSYFELSRRVDLLEYKLGEVLQIQASAEEDIDQLFTAVDLLNDSSEDSSDTSDDDLFRPFYPSRN